VSGRPPSTVLGPDGTRRCWWCSGDPLYERYHDQEWGRPARSDVNLFEHVCLEGFQAGLSWLTVLRKRAAFDEAFHGFDIEAVARFNRRSVDRLLGNAGIIRHRGKIESAINNARRALEVIDEHGSLAEYFWRFAPPAQRRRVTRGTIPVSTPEAAALSKDLKGRGWTFVGPTGIYAFMQGCGLVNDHVAGCDVRSRTGPPRRVIR